MSKLHIGDVFKSNGKFYRVLDFEKFNPEQLRDNRGRWTRERVNADWEHLRTPTFWQKLTGSALSGPEKKQIAEIMDGGLYSINTNLRRGKKLNAEDRQTVDLLDKAFNRSKLKQPLTVFRGVAPEAVKYEVGPVGKVVHIPGYIHTSLDPYGAATYAMLSDKALVFMLPKGTPVLFGDEHIWDNGSRFSEYEVLLQRGLSYKIVSMVDKDTYLAQILDTKVNKRALTGG